MLGTTASAVPGWQLMARRLASLLLVIGTVLASAIVFPSAAHAVCTCSATTPQQGMADSAVVFVGSLTELSPPVDDLVTLDFDVRLIYKGDLGEATQLVTFRAADQCGVGDTARRGEWLVFGYTIPGGDGVPLLSTCSPSRLLTAGATLPVELGEGRAPPGVESLTPAVVTSALLFRGSVTDPKETASTIAGAVLLLAAVGIVARLLAGRRRFVVR